MTIKPGTVHFELGFHVTAQDANHRLREHFEAKELPEHFVTEQVPYSPFEAASMTEEQFMQYARKASIALQTEAAILSQGRLRAVKHVYEKEPYHYRKVRLILSANQPKPMISVHTEPFSEEAAREYYHTFTDYAGMADHVMQGKLQPALLSYRRFMSHFIRSQLAREKTLLNYLEGLHKDHPNSRILVDYGSDHEHLPQLLQKLGIPTTHRTIEPHALPEGRLIKTLLKKHYGLQQTTEEEIEELHKRGFLAKMLVTENRMTDERAAKILDNLSKEDTAALFKELDQPGKRLDHRIVEWLREHKKL